MTEHKHESERRSVRNISGGGSITLETCGCGALRSVIERNGKTLISEWEIEEDEEEVLEVLDVDPDNDND